jgi:hypothetical protein
MLPIAKFIKTHANANNGEIYKPTFIDGSGHGDSNGSIGTWSPNWFAVHNPSATPQSVTIWTVDQGTSGSGSVVYLVGGGTFYTNITKLTVGSGRSVTLFGTTNTTATMI